MIDMYHIRNILLRQKSFKQMEKTIAYRIYSIIRRFAYKTGPILTSNLHSSEWTIFYLSRPRL